jgi:uncharacterized membrane protein HdeD (DUF308 family)
MYMLARNWWVVALRGLVSLIFGGLAIVWPQPAVAVLVILFGAYALTDGVFALAAVLTGRAEHWGALLLEGLLGIAAGVITFLVPGWVELVLVYLIAGWAVATGVLEIVAAVRLRRHIENEFWLALGGAVSILFGVLVFANPWGGVIAIAWMVGIYAILFGATLLSLGFRLRRFHRLWGESPRHIPGGGTALPAR